LITTTRLDVRLLQQTLVCTPSYLTVLARVISVLHLRRPQRSPRPCGQHLKPRILTGGRPPAERHSFSHSGLRRKNLDSRVVVRRRLLLVHPPLLRQCLPAPHSPVRLVSALRLWLTEGGGVGSVLADVVGLDFGVGDAARAGRTAEIAGDLRRRRWRKSASWTGDKSEVLAGAYSSVSEEGEHTGEKKERVKANLKWQDKHTRIFLLPLGDPKAPPSCAWFAIVAAVERSRRQECKGGDAREGGSRERRRFERLDRSCCEVVKSIRGLQKEGTRY
jgi:hypothetical protein